MYCVLRLMYPVRVKCFSVHSEFFDWFQSCMCLKLHPVSPFSVFTIGHVLHPFYSDSGMSVFVYRCTLSCWSIRPMFIGIIVSVYYSTSPCWCARPMFIGTLLPVYYFTFSHWRNRRISAHCFIGQPSSRCCWQTSPKTIYTLAPSPYLPAFSTFHPSTNLHISPQLLKAFTSPEHLLLSQLQPSTSLCSVSTPSERCALHCAPFRVYSS